MAPKNDHMLAKALTFLGSLPSTLQRRATFSLEDEERYRWNYKPAVRRGVAMRQLSARQYRAALTLLESAFSSQGYVKAVNIMALEEILAEIEGRPAWDRTRDTLGYYLTFFGNLSSEAQWGWRIDGHHLSLTVTVAPMDQVSITPAFMGANPAEIPHGPQRGLRILKQEEDLARQFLQTLAPSQMKQAVIAHEAPADIVTGTNRQINNDMSLGLPASEMLISQRDLLLQLVAMYAHNLQQNFAEPHLKRIQSAGIERLSFAWAGGFSRSEGHYYRIQGPTVLIEYDNTQSNANHIHTVMRDPERDFGEDPLRCHYAESFHGFLP